VPSIESALPKLKHKKLKPIQKTRAKSTLKQLSPAPITRRQNYSTSVSTSDSIALRSFEERTSRHTRVVKSTFAVQDLDQVNAVTTPASSKKSASHFENILDDSLLEYYENDVKQSAETRIYSKTPEPSLYFPKPIKLAPIVLSRPEPIAKIEDSPRHFKRSAKLANEVRKPLNYVKSRPSRLSPVRGGVTAL
jgi:hypothetical protein